MALAIRNAVKIQVDDRTEIPRLPAIWGNATLTIVESSTTMKVAIEITPVKIHGLRAPAADRSLVHAGVGAVVVAMVPILPVT